MSEVVNTGLVQDVDGDDGVDGLDGVEVPPPDVFVEVLVDVGVEDLVVVGVELGGGVAVGVAVGCTDCCWIVVGEDVLSFAAVVTGFSATSLLLDCIFHIVTPIPTITITKIARKILILGRCSMVRN